MYVQLTCPLQSLRCLEFRYVLCLASSLFHPLSHSAVYELGIFSSKWVILQNSLALIGFWQVVMFCVIFVMAFVEGPVQYSVIRLLLVLIAAKCCYCVHVPQLMLEEEWRNLWKIKWYYKAIGQIKLSSPQRGILEGSPAVALPIMSSSLYPVTQCLQMLN